MLTALQQRKLPNLFAVQDTNKDGYLEWSDYEAFHRQLMALRGVSLESSPSQDLLARLRRRARDRGRDHGPHRPILPQRRSAAARQLVLWPVLSAVRHLACRTKQRPAVSKVSEVSSVPSGAGRLGRVGRLSPCFTSCDG